MLLGSKMAVLLLSWLHVRPVQDYVVSSLLSSTVWSLVKTFKAADVGDAFLSCGMSDTDEKDSGFGN